MSITLDGTDGINTPQINGGNIVGQVCFFGMTTAPEGFLKANGAAVSRTTYADLFAAIGTTYGAGDGSTTFTLPDLRGEFPRGFDDGRGVDSGRTFGSFQSQQAQDHKHNTAMGFDPTDFYGWQAADGNPIFGSEVILDVTRTSIGANTVSSTALRIAHTDFMRDITGETRPRNISLLACIKF